MNEFKTLIFAAWCVFVEQWAKPVEIVQLSKKLNKINTLLPRANSATWAQLRQFKRFSLVNFGGDEIHHLIEGILKVGQVVLLTKTNAVGQIAAANFLKCLF